MAITFPAEVGTTRHLGDYVVTSVKHQPEGRKFPQFVDLKWKADDHPSLLEGSRIRVTMKYLPDARGYESRKVNENTGKPYINGTLVIYNPEVEVLDDIDTPQEWPEVADDDVPFHHIPADRYGVTRCGHLRF